jgi:hypothetical protein
MRLPEKMITARVNGRGRLVTQEAICRASFKGRRHDLSFQVIVLPEHDFDKLISTDGAKFTYVQELAASAARLRRLWKVGIRPWEVDTIGRIAGGFGDLVRHPDLPVLHHDAVHLSARQRTLNSLFLLGDTDYEPNLDPSNPPEIIPIAPTSPNANRTRPKAQSGAKAKRLLTGVEPIIRNANPTGLTQETEALRPILLAHAVYQANLDPNNPLGVSRIAPTSPNASPTRPTWRQCCVLANGPPPSAARRHLLPSEALAVLNPPKLDRHLDV